MAWREGIHWTPKINSTRRENRDLDTMNLVYRCKSYLSLRSDVGSEELSSSGGITANDVSWSLVLAWRSVWNMIWTRIRLTNNVSGVGPVAGKDGSVGTRSGSTSNLGGALPDDLGEVTGS